MLLMFIFQESNPSNESGNRGGRFKIILGGLIIGVLLILAAVAGIVVYMTTGGTTILVREPSPYFFM